MKARRFAPAALGARSPASRIVPTLHPGAGVVTTRGHVQWVVTEHGVVDLYGKGLQERATLLTSIAAPEHREALERASRERYRT